MKVSAEVFAGAKFGANRPHELWKIYPVQSAKPPHGCREHVSADFLGKAQPFKCEMPHDLPTDAVQMVGFRLIAIPARGAAGKVRLRFTGVR